MQTCQHIAAPDFQRILLQVPPRPLVINNGQARNAYGAIAAEIVCHTLNLDPIRINGNYKVCFDAKRGDVFYEIKSVRKNNKIVIYEWRLRKEMEAGVDLFYAIFVHQVRGARTLILEKMLEGCFILLVPFKVIFDACQKCSLKFAKTNDSPRAGYSRKGYCDGYYNVPMQVIKEKLKIRQEIASAIYGVNYRIPLWMS